MSEPICIFESIQQAASSLKEWQERLFLSDWIIHLNLEDKVFIDGEEVCGKNDFQTVNKTAAISIAKYSTDYGNRIVKFCHECTLVHELLHCKYNRVFCGGESIEAVYYDSSEHALLEQMAKSLIMAKYGVLFSWFDNI